MFNPYTPSPGFGTPRKGVLSRAASLKRFTTYRFVWRSSSPVRAPAQRIAAADPPSIFSLEAVAAAQDGGEARAAERRREADRAAERDRVAGRRDLSAPSSNDKDLAVALVALGSLRERWADTYQEKLGRGREDARTRAGLPRPKGDPAPVPPAQPRC